MIDNQDELIQIPQCHQTALDRALRPAEAMAMAASLPSNGAAAGALVPRFFRVRDKEGRRVQKGVNASPSAFASDSRPVIVVCGLEAEARIARAPGLIVIVGGSDRRRLERELDVAAPSAKGIVSFGVAGGLAPGMRPGDTFVADTITSPRGQKFSTHRTWSAAIAAILQAQLCTMAGVDHPLVDSQAKADVHGATGAIVADMESHVVAAAADRYQVPLAAVRVVTDPAEHTLPHAATVGMGADGRLDVKVVLRSLATRPGQIPNLIRTGLDARTAFAALLRCRQRLGPGFALLNLG